MSENIEIINFYEFKRMAEVGDLAAIKEELRRSMADTGVRGTIILADEGFNASLCGTRAEIDVFIPRAEAVLRSDIRPKVSFYAERPLRKIDVKIKPEIVTLKQDVDLDLGKGTHVTPSEWNRLITDQETLVLDTRNDYEYKSGTFRNAVNPHTAKFSDLPAYVAENLDPEKHKRIAMFCTGGIRCEKFAPYMRQLGFEEVYQLEGGILKYLETVPPEESSWVGECFVFDERVTVDHDLRRGTGIDHSQRHPERCDP